MSPDLSVSDVAVVLRIRRESIVRLIRSGALVGYDASPPGAKRPTWRVPAKSLEDFKAGRVPKQEQAVSKFRQAKPVAAVKEWF